MQLYDFFKYRPQADVTLKSNVALNVTGPNICEDLYEDAETECFSHKFSVVRVLGDGRCFFRCMASSGLQCLQLGSRSRNGRLIQSALAESEQRFADQIRQSTVEFLEKHSDTLGELVHSVPMLLDRGISDVPYTSLATRLQMMSKHSEYAGYLEITAVAFIIQRPIFIYAKLSCHTKLKLIAKLPLSVADESCKWNWKSRTAINLLHSFDTDLHHPGHFDLLLVKATTTTDDSLSVVDFKSMATDAVTYELSFTEVLIPAAATAPLMVENSSCPRAKQESATQLLSTGASATIEKNTQSIPRYVEVTY
jgi:hypothetical protein